MHLNNKTTTLTNKNQQKQKGTIYDNSFTSKPAKKGVAPRQRTLSLHNYLNVRKHEVKSYLRGELTQSRTEELSKEIHKLGIVF